MLVNIMLISTRLHTKDIVGTQFGSRAVMSPPHIQTNLSHVIMPKPTLLIPFLSSCILAQSH